MSNKIEGYGQPLLPGVSGTRGSAPTDSVARSDGKPVEPVSPARDSVSVSDSALLLQRLEETVAKTPVSDVNHVQQIKNALAHNAYVVNAQRVADKMLQFERALGGYTAPR
jgi:negative regulator of flagellin synthesis FlgM